MTTELEDRMLLQILFESRNVKVESIAIITLATTGVEELTTTMCGAKTITIIIGAVTKVRIKGNRKSLIVVH